MCAPLYEAVPCDLVAERCWVLDPHTFCKGNYSYSFLSKCISSYFYFFLFLLLFIYFFLTKDDRLVLHQSIRTFASIALIVLLDYLQRLPELGIKFARNLMHSKHFHNALNIIVHIW